MNAVRRPRRLWRVAAIASLLAGATGLGSLHARASQAGTGKPSDPVARHLPPPQGKGHGAAASEAARLRELAPFAPPTGGDKTGASSQAIALPQGAGKIDGMGESFSTQMSTGGASMSVPFKLSHARGSVQPNLGLTYASGGGHGAAGVGWDVGWAFVARQTDRGLPNFDDRAAWHPEQDRFVFSAGQELVPICQVSGSACVGALPGEVMPAWANGWQYFRARVEGSYTRFFWSPDHQTWRVQSKSGGTMELGVPLDGSGDRSSLEADPANASHVFRWNVSRESDSQADANGAPVNVVRYRYVVIDGIAWLVDIFDTPPASNPAAAPLSQWAHHVRVAYERRPDATFSFRRGYRTALTQRVVGVDVTSKPFIDGGATSAPRELVRRYHLAYDAGSHVSLLTGVTLEGRCPTTISEDAGESLPAVTGCPSLTPMSFGYQRVSAFHTDGSASVADLAGYDGFDERIHSMIASPNHSIDEQLTDLFDINSDGLPDVLVTNPGEFGGSFGVFFNGYGGAADSFGLKTLGVAGVLGANAGTITLANDNVQPLDLDGDGVIDFVHMPQVQTYAVYSPHLAPNGWVLQGRPVTTADQLDPRIDLGQDTSRVAVVDVNGDGLVDFVRTNGTEIQTFFALGRYPEGDGRFGSATWTGASSASISTLPTTACLPFAGNVLEIGDSDVKLADMNGDGLADIVRIHQGDVRYWPGRGNGFWGTGALGDCPAGAAAQGREVTMVASPAYSDPSGTGLRLDDVNGDGLDDLVQVRETDVDVWLNVDGVSFTPRHVIVGTPAAPAFANRVRLVDINGSGTRDIVWGDGGAFRYIDLAGGNRPWILNHVENGLGKSTDIEYSTSTAMMLADEAAGQEWHDKAPTVVPVVKRVTERDNLDRVGAPSAAFVTEYTYRDAVFDGRQREFRGFRSARARRIGDANSPSSTTTSTFALGECADDEPPPANASSRCAPDGRWADNPREALKGLVLVSETLDDANVYASTQHHSYTLRRLYTGLDGREVRVAFESATDRWLYDTAAFVPSSAHVGITDFHLELTAGVPAGDTPSTVNVRATAARLHSEVRVDAFGNATDTIDSGCVAGCSVVDDVITHHTEPVRPAGDLSGWLFRTAETWVKGSNDSAARKHTYSSFDARGNATQASADLVGTLPLVRFHESPGKSVAPAPARASADGHVAMGTSQYDVFGNVLVTATPNQRCRTFAYASDYADLVVGETAYAGAASGNCGSVPLIASARYDRGLGVTTRATDLHGELTAVDYDGFGRVVAITKPSPAFVGQLSPQPSSRFDYDAATPQRPFSIVHTLTHDGADETVASYRESYSYVDGFGRGRVGLSQADPSAGDGGQWTVSGLSSYDAKGGVQRAYLPWFWNGAPRAFPLATVPPTAYSRQRYDAFGAPLQTYGVDGGLVSQMAHHALSTDRWDAADLQAGPHQGTYASTRNDGHGRLVAVTERTHVGSAIEAHETRTTYLSTGETVSIARVRVGAADPPVLRWFRYDSLGRMVLNVEPDTTKGFISDPGTSPDAMRAWRYAYDDNGEIVGTSDARGCGANFAYDAAGRIVAEDLSPCVASQSDYSPPNVQTGDGVEVLYRYDAPDPTVPSAIDDCAVDAKLLTGRLASVTDRAAKSVVGYDGRGRQTCVARQIAKPAAQDQPAATRFAAGWFSQSIAYDGADRQVQTSTGAKVAELLGTGTQSFVRTAFSKRGTVSGVGSSYGDLVTSVTRDADALVTKIVYGDLASTTSSLSYDARRRVASAQTYRAAAPAWSASPAAYSPAPTVADGTLQLLLEDLEYGYDVVDNPVEIRDYRTASEWPAGAQPVTRKIQYDDLYRVTRVDYQYPGASDGWVSPFAAEEAGVRDPRRAAPPPHLSFAHRVVSQSFQYDWLGNTTRTDDDSSGFFDRSLGAIANGNAGAGPYQLRSAAGGGSPRDGALSTKYDDAGNLVALSVIRSANAPCWPSPTSCSMRFAYDWDEVGRLVRARRWDGVGLGVAVDPLPSQPPSADVRYAFDASDNRVLKSVVDATGAAAHTVYALDSLELRRTAFDGNAYVRSASTEVPYLMAHGVRLARVHFADASVPLLPGSGQAHVLLELPDRLGSNSIVIDRATGELVERTTYDARGARESDYRPSRWESYRDDYGFTGKEDDAEVGLEYFGKRFLSQALGRWVSADPLAVHGAGADLNVYAYVHGALLRAFDPTGLEQLDGGVPEASQKNSNGPGGEDGHARPDTSEQDKANEKAEESSASTSDTQAPQGPPAPPPAPAKPTAQAPPRATPRPPPDCSTGRDANLLDAFAPSYNRMIGVPMRTPLACHPDPRVQAYGSFIGQGQSQLASGAGNGALGTTAVVAAPSAALALAPSAGVLYGEGTLYLGTQLMVRAPLVYEAITGAGVVGGTAAAGARASGGGSTPVPPPMAVPAIVRELRRVGTPQALATAKLIKRGDVELVFRPIAGGASGLQPFGTNQLLLDPSKMRTLNEAAGLAGHEAKHWLQGLTPQTYHLGHELEAYVWQAGIQKGILSNPSGIWQWLLSHPLYSNVPRPPGGP